MTGDMRLLIPVLIAGLCFGCGDDSGGPSSVDVDGDGYTQDKDCDDTDALVSPGAPEITYDGKDNDCNPATPDDDLDGDGHPLADDCDETGEEGGDIGL